MPPIEVTCANPDCGEKFQVGPEMAGELVECPKCGASVYVLEPEDELQMMTPAEQVKGKARDEKGHIAHPARLTCPNCHAVLGVRDAICPSCGADVRTGAAVMTKVERKKLNLVPFLIGGGILLALAAVVVLAVLAVRIVSKHSENARKAAEAAAAAAAAPLAKVPVAEPVAKPKPAYEMPAAVLTELADREAKAGQAVDAYAQQLHKTLAAVAAADHDQAAAAWADLVQFCVDKGLQAEAEQAWYQAARLGSHDAAVNQKLGLTDTYEGVPVTPIEKQFLLALKPKLKVINRDAALRDCVAVIKGLEPVAIPLGKVVELEPAAGPIVLAVARTATPDRSTEEFALTAEPGIEQTVEINSPYAAPSLPFDALGAIYSVVGDKQEVAGVTVEKDAAGHITKAGGGDIFIVGSSDAPVEMWLTRTRDQLAMIGSIPLGNRFQTEGRKLFSGNRLHPISFTIVDQTTPLRLAAGGYAVVHADLSDGLWGLLGTVNGDVAYEGVRSRLESRLTDLAFQNTDMEARGELFGPWQTRVRLYDEMSAQSDQLQHALADRKSAAGMPLWRDRVRLLGLSENNDTIYLNWPRFRAALAIALKGSAEGIAEKLAMIGPPSTGQPAGQPNQLGPGAAQPTSAPLGPGMPGAQAPSFTLPQAVSAPDRDTALLHPAAVPLDDAARAYALLRALPLLPDDAVLQKVQDMWPNLKTQDRMAALMALEQTASPQAIAWLGQLAQTATDSDVTAMALLSLGSIGTKEALAQTEMPGVAAKVRTASLVAAVVAGKPDAIEQVPAFLAAASPDESAAFLQYITEFDTPGTLLALSQAIDSYKDPQSGARIATALCRMGGKAAMRELSRLMQKTGEVYADKLGDLRGDDALLLVRQVGSALVAQKTTDAGALHVLTADGSAAAVAFLLSDAINHGDAAAVAALCRMGTAPALEAAGQAVKAITPEMLTTLRGQWYTPATKDAKVAWTAGVDAAAARKLLEKVFAEGGDPEVRIQAAAMLQETGTPLPSEQLLAFAGTTAGAAPAGKFSFAAFEWPVGRPLNPEGTKLDAAPGLYALGLALQAKDAGLGAGLQSLLASTPNGPLKAASAVALGRLGGEENLKVLHDAATKTKDSYTDTADLAKVLQDRLAALAGLAETQDAAFLPRVLDMLKEAPPAASGVPKAENFAELADWWQIELWRGACDCVAGICRQRSPLELAADSGLQTMLTDRLKALIDEPGPKRESLSAYRQELRASAIRAFGRVADFNDTANSFIISRLVVDLTQKETAAAQPAGAPGMPGMPGMPPNPGAPGMPGQPQEIKADPLRIAMLDAVAHAGSRAQSISDYAGYARTLTAGPAMKEAWASVVRQMADAPTAGYFALLTAVADTVDQQTDLAVFDATKSAADAKGQQYGTFLAALLGAGPQPAAAQPTATAAAPTGQEPPAGTNGPGISQAQIQALMEKNRQEAMAYAQQMVARMQGPPSFAQNQTTTEGVAGPHRPAAGVVPEYDRHLPYKWTDWQYNLDAAGKQVAELRQKWAIIQALIESSGSALPGVVQTANLLTGCDLGPAAAPALVKLDASQLDSVTKQLGGLLAPDQTPAAGAAPGAPASPGTSPMASMDARRTAIAALRTIGGQPAADALYTGLVGPVSAPQPAMPGGMPPGMMMPQVPEYARQAMAAARAASADPVPIFIARALGSMGRYDLLHNALAANDRKFFVQDAVTVQCAALSGMAYLPATDDPMTKLADLVRLANVESIRKAAVDALVTAARLAGRQV